MVRKVLITVVVLIILVAAAVVMVHPFVVPDLAVSPTLNKNETVLVNTAENLVQAKLKRFELVVIVPPFVNGRPYNPEPTMLDTVSDYSGLPIGSGQVRQVRRVIALPGETVVVRKGLGIFIDGKMLDETSYTKDEPMCDIFVLADITRQNSGVQPYQNSEAPIVVPPDMVFVLADNREEFPGSEKWGFVSQQRIVGKVAYKLGSSGLQEIKTPKLTYATEKIAINDDGVRALDKGEYTKAIHLFKSALAIDNNFELARDNLSIAYNNFAIKSVVKNPDVALDSLHKALFLDPDNQLTKKNLAGVLKRLGKSADSYKDRVALAEEAAKHGKSISALVEYRAAVNLNPNPAILAKISSLEAQCNFPAHAIPEDLVTATAHSGTEADAPRSEFDTTNKMAVPTALAQLKQTVAEEKKVEVKKDEAKKAAEKAEPKPETAKSTTFEPAAEDESKPEPPIAQSEEEDDEEADAAPALTKLKPPSLRPNLEHRDLASEVAARMQEADEQEARKNAEEEKAKTNSSTEKTSKVDDKDRATASSKQSSQNKRSSNDKGVSKMKVFAESKKADAKKEDTKKSAAAEPKQIASKPASLKSEQGTTDTPLQTTTLKKQDGFDLGAFMQNIVSAITPKGTKNDAASESNSNYHGPPLMKKQQAP